MNQPIEKLMVRTTPEYTLTTAGRTLITTHIKWLRESPRSRTVQVAPNDIYRFSYCLNAYLHSISVDVKLHWPTMLINGLNSAEDFDSRVKSLIIPDLEDVNTILNTADMQ